MKTSWLCLKRGQSITEYLTIGSMVGMTVLGAVQLVGTDIRNLYVQANSEMAGGDGEADSLDMLNNEASDSFLDEPDPGSTNTENSRGNVSYTTESITTHSDGSSTRTTTTYYDNGETSTETKTIPGTVPVDSETMQKISTDDKSYLERYLPLVNEPTPPDTIDPVNSSYLSGEQSYSGSFGQDRITETNFTQEGSNLSGTIVIGGAWGSVRQHFQGTVEDGHVTLTGNQVDWIDRRGGVNYSPDNIKLTQMAGGGLHGIYSCPDNGDSGVVVLHAG